MLYRLSLDLGTNSIGWCQIELDHEKSPIKILNAGVRIFANGRESQGDTSLAVTRRLARQARRRRDRFIRRRKNLMRALIKHGLMPCEESERKALELLDPYALRAKGVNSPLTLYELGRSLFHLNQRRGFKSSRKIAHDGDAPKLKPAMERLREQMGDMTYGQFLYSRKRLGKHVRARKTGEGIDEDYDFYPERSIVEAEFNTLWDAQSSYHKSLTPDIRQELHNIIFFQRPLKPVNPGRCTLEPDQKRCARAMPLAQDFRILQELNHLQIVSPDLTKRSLTLTERDLLFEQLKKKRVITFAGIRKTLTLRAGTSFNLEGQNREKLIGDETAALIGGKNGIGKRWREFDNGQQNRIVAVLLDTDDEEDLLGQLTQDWDLTLEEAKKLSALDLPAGFIRLSLLALMKIVPNLVKEVVPYSEAVLLAGYPSHSALGEDRILSRLPYYGLVLERHVNFGTNKPSDPLAEKFGRVANPTVHIALNQVRRCVNELIKLYGHPTQVVLEVSRDLKNSPIVRRRIEKEQAKNRHRNERLKENLNELGLADRGDGVLRLRLWEELHHDPAARCCPYTGEHISIEALFSGDVEIDHILPFSRTLDDSIANKTISLRKANRDKGNRTPHEAFGSSPIGYDWDRIVARAIHMPRNKRWRFAEDAMLEFEENGDFLARQLTDNQFIAKLSREYLTAICPENDVWVTPGRLTYLLARAWGFPQKKRDDHRHHARDAIIIGLTDRKTLQSVAYTHKQTREEGFHKFLSELEPPISELRQQVITTIEKIIVSHRTDHGIEGQLHNDTAYGIAAKNGNPRNAEHRIPVSEIRNPGKLLAIKGRRLKAELLSFLTQKPFNECRDILLEFDRLPPTKSKKMIKEFIKLDDKNFIEKSKLFYVRRGIRRVRIAETEPLIAIRDMNGKAYKGFKGDSNAYYDIFINPEGKWEGKIVSTFDANQPDYESKFKRMEGYQRVTKLFRGDMLEIVHNGVPTFVYVVKISAKQIALAEHHEANVDSRTRDKDDDFRLIYKSSPAALQNISARPIHVTPAGRLFYLEVPYHAGKGGGDSR